MKRLLWLPLFAAVACRPAPDTLTVPGTIEVEEVDAAPIQGGRVLRVGVDEGDTVRAGDTVAVLTRTTLPATLQERRARVAAARARLADLVRGSREAEMARARAEVAAAEVEADRTARDLLRTERLAEDGVISQQQLEQARAAAATAGRQRDAARATLELYREGTRTDQIRAAEADVRTAEAQLAGTAAEVSDLAVLAAVSGVVLGRHADPGEVIAGGTPIVTIGRTEAPWVRVYLTARALARLPPTAEAQIRLAGEAGPVFPGTLAAINSKAEFTPRVALTEEERADLVFAARVRLDQASPLLRPGLPVRVTFQGTGR